MANPENKQIPYESTQQDIRDAIESVATAIGGIAVPSADHVSYDNSGSGLSATDVQNALDEIVSDIPTVNNGTLTIQQNGTSKGSFTANSASNVNVNIETPTADKKTATDQFTTADGGLLSKCQINLVPVQSGSGDPSPDNVRPISGHTEVDLYNVGKNICSTPTWSANASKQLNRIEFAEVENGVTYALSFIPLETNLKQIRFYVNGVLNDLVISANNLVANTRYDTLITANGTGTLDVRTNADAFTTASDVVIKDIQLEKGNQATAYEPYLGHLYQVQIGSTVYGGYVDLVSGVMIAEYAILSIADMSGWFKVTDDPTYPWFTTLNGLSGIDVSKRDSIICNKYKNKTPTANNHDDTCFGLISNGSQFRVRDMRYNTAADFANSLSDCEFIVPLASPQTIQLTPQQIETLAGQNNLSTPLDGQSIETNGVEYKELFTFADVKEYVKPLIPYSNAGSHNAIYRGKYLGDHVTPEQWASIVAGTFDDLFIGDYWTINSVNWRIAHFDYWLGTGDTECTTHHVVIVPDTALYNAKMNSSNITTGGYYNSEMRGGSNYLVSGSSNLYSASETIKSAFGSSHILTHRELLTNDVTSGSASNWDYYDSSVELMSEVMIYGCSVWSMGGGGYEIASSNEQLALFRHDITKVTNRANYWLRNVHNASDFCDSNRYGRPFFWGANNATGVRPCFAIK